MVEDNGKFAGWRLVRFIRRCGDRFSGLDLAVGDVLVSVNGRVLMKPTDLATLWQDLYKADVIVAEMRRGTAPFVLRFNVVPALATTSTAEPAATP
jgi:type II secretory pathway component PulC